MGQNKFLEKLFQRLWVYYVTTFALAAFGYFNPLVEWLEKKNSFARLSLAQSLLLAANCIFFFFVKSPQLLQANEAPDTSDSPPVKAYEKLGYADYSWDAAKVNAVDSLWQFRTAWLCALGSWALLYAAFFFLSLRDGQSEWHVFEDLVLDMLNVASHAAVVACYVILARDTTGSQRIPPRACGLFVLFFFGVPEVGVVSVLSQAPDSAVATERVILYFGAVIGIFGGMFLGLMVGQLDNEYLDAPVWLLALLFGYAAIQPLYPILHSTATAWGVTNALPKELVDGSRTTLIGAAGVLKLLLCGFLYRCFTNGRLLFYFARKRANVQKVDEEWGHFNKMMRGKDAARP